MTGGASVRFSDADDPGDGVAVRAVTASEWRRPGEAVESDVEGGLDGVGVVAGSGPRSVRTDQSERLARAWLSRAAEPGNRLLWAYVETYGAIATAAALRAGEGPGPIQALVGPRRAEDRSADDLQAAGRLGVRLVIPGDDEWPDAPLRGMAMAAAAGSLEVVPPLALWVRGSTRLDVAVESSVAMVGSRASTGYGEHVAADLAHGLALRGWTVVSGGAFGIDAAAHRGALSAEGRTVAVLAGGLDRPYPRGNGALFERILDTGLLVSEWPPGCSAMRRRFLIRNRLVAGLAAGTVVVEAAARSGTRSTAGRTLDLGRPLMAVPGPVTSALSVGCLALLRLDGVRPVGTVDHVLEEVGRIGADLAAPAQGHRTPRDELSAVQSAVLDAVPSHRPAPPERIAMVAGVVVTDVLRVLPGLELLGLVELTSRGWRLAPASRARPRG